MATYPAKKFIIGPGRVRVEYTSGDYLIIARRHNDEVSIEDKNAVITFGSERWQELVNAVTPLPATIDRGPPQVGEVTGWRVWRLDNSGYLRSLHIPVAWPPDRTVEGDLERTGRGGSGGGVYAYKHQSDAWEELERHHRAILGRVALSGEVIEHQRGYRATAATVLSLDAASDWWTARQLPQLRRRYRASGNGTVYLTKFSVVVPLRHSLLLCLMASICGLCFGIVFGLAH